MAAETIEKLTLRVVGCPAGAATEIAAIVFFDAASHLDRSAYGGHFHRRKGAP
ncbi:hypothetical protein [Bradyrhizobium sp. CCBAU 53421]|uniref:hypothetical protein n=1 Tax=Bradyrhizobium sp. CCBAU 53421 TaxID=1325120 RepID=UPI00188A6535|nr:hypothetical protein [Bradyrhizobium sp. CCBAU 53421]